MCWPRSANKHSLFFHICSTKRLGQRKLPEPFGIIKTGSRGEDPQLPERLSY